MYEISFRLERASRERSELNAAAQEQEVRGAMQILGQRFVYASCESTASSLPGSRTSSCTRGARALLAQSPIGLGLTAFARIKTR